MEVVSIFKFLRFFAALFLFSFAVLITPILCLTENAICELALTEKAFVEAAKKTGPAVVSVSVIQVYTYGGRQYYYPFENFDPYLDEFLKDFFGSSRRYRQSGMGSGVIIDEDGYILTNEHVVSGADEIEVTFSDGRKFKGILKGADPRSDLAVIKIEADNLPVAPLGDSSNVRPGQFVMAIGNPFGFIMSNPQPTITVGVVSAVHRSFSYRGIDQHRYYGDLIQTDAAINRGNSGGPLVNLKGEIIGINALIYSTTGGYQGIGFAIPINRAKRILDELIEGKEITYGWLGVQVQSASPELMELFNFPDNKGALIAEIISGSPADTGGLKKGDLIRRINDREIISSNDLVNIVTGLEVGQNAEIFVLRDGRDEKIKIAVGARPRDEDVLTRTETVKRTRGWRGIEVVESDRGIKIYNIVLGSDGFNSGIKENDIIDEIDRKEIRTLDDFNKTTKNSEGEVLIHTNRGYFVVKGKN